jgi:hypothetical protein
VKSACDLLGALRQVSRVDLRCHFLMLTLLKKPIAGRM